ncbi:flagellar motor switch protein FliN [Tianweitania sediminis]|jgi:flagellar motor switch protein FliN/FliY|uniref:Flagellar motor switch protein FliN n=2 Tax=Tianweitania sediminis TaxID=1502156 RepID=A0A8J7ULX6_9HYPH|nr:flagellar motor switch protein FliN [Tianweitania sediminis]
MVDDTELAAQEDQLNKAIEELKGVLHEGQGGVAQAPAAAAKPRNNNVIMNIPVDVQMVLGSASMPVSDLMALQKGSVVALDRRIGEPVDVVVNGRMIARGEITVMESDTSRFGIRLTEIIQATRSA